MAEGCGEQERQQRVQAQPAKSVSSWVQAQPAKSVSSGGRAPPGRQGRQPLATAQQNTKSGTINQSAGFLRLREPFPGILLCAAASASPLPRSILRV